MLQTKKPAGGAGARVDWMVGSGGLCRGPCGLFLIRYYFLRVIGCRTRVKLACAMGWAGARGSRRGSVRGGQGDGCGRRFTSRLTSQSHWPGFRSDITSVPITQEDPILALTGRHRIRFTLMRCSYPKQLNQNGQESTYKLGSAVQTTGATSQ